MPLWHELGAARRDLTRGSVHASWCPLSPIYTLGFSELIERSVEESFRVYFSIYVVFRVV